LQVVSFVHAFSKNLYILTACNNFIKYKKRKGYEQNEYG
jgi:hypothetical protein